MNLARSGDDTASDADLIHRARTYLRMIPRLEADQHGGAGQDALDLAYELKARSRFSYARRVFREYLSQAEQTLGRQERFKIVLEQALCTYKDKDLAADYRYDWAIQLLESDGTPIHERTEIEALGQAGSIYRRKWEHDFDTTNLWRSWHFYHEGYKRALEDPEAPPDHLAWTAINAAHSLDLIAHEDRAEGGYRLDEMKVVRSKAAKIRADLIDRLSPIARTTYDVLSAEGFGAASHEAKYAKIGSCE